MKFVTLLFFGVVALTWSAGEAATIEELKKNVADDAGLLVDELTNFLTVMKVDLSKDSLKDFSKSLKDMAWDIIDGTGKMLGMFASAFSQNNTELNESAMKLLTKSIVGMSATMNVYLKTVADSVMAHVKMGPMDLDKEVRDAIKGQTLLGIAAVNGKVSISRRNPNGIYKVDAPKGDITVEATKEKWVEKIVIDGVNYLIVTDGEQEWPEESTSSSRPSRSNRSTSESSSSRSSRPGRSISPSTSSTSTTSSNYRSRGDRTTTSSTSPNTQGDFSKDIDDAMANNEIKPISSDDGNVWFNRRSVNGIYRIDTTKNVTVDARNKKASTMVVSGKTYVKLSDW